MIGMEIRRRLLLLRVLIMTTSSIIDRVAELLAEAQRLRAELRQLEALSTITNKREMIAATRADRDLLAAALGVGIASLICSHKATIDASLREIGNAATRAATRAAEFLGQMWDAAGTPVDPRGGHQCSFVGVPGDGLCASSGPYALTEHEDYAFTCGKCGHQWTQTPWDPAKQACPCCPKCSGDLDAPGDDQRGLDE